MTLESLVNYVAVIGSLSAGWFLTEWLRSQTALNKAKSMELYAKARWSLADAHRINIETRLRESDLPEGEDQ